MDHGFDTLSGDVEWHEIREIKKLQAGVLTHEGFIKSVYSAPPEGLSVRSELSRCLRNKESDTNTPIIIDRTPDLTSLTPPLTFTTLASCT